MKIVSRHSLILSLLMLVFLAPGLAALYFYTHPSLLGEATTNKGEFVRPAILIKSLTTLKATLNPINKKENKQNWHLVLWSPKGCDEACHQSLEQLARVRLALGRYYYEVGEALLLSESSIEPSMSSQGSSRVGEIVPLSKTEERALLALSNERRIFIADASGYLIFSYDVTAQSDDIYHDLKHLLTTTQTKSI